MDFGLARRIDKDDARLTKAGDMLGTPAYMPPEQASGDVEAMGPPSDIYSLGVMLYRMTTGKMPFSGDTTMAVLTSLAVDAPISPRQHNPQLSEALEAVITKALAKNPADRFQSARELVDALGEIGPDASAALKELENIAADKKERDRPFKQAVNSAIRKIRQ